MTRTLSLAALSMTCGLLLACSPPHFVRIELEGGWPEGAPLQLYLRRTVSDSSSGGLGDLVLTPDSYPDRTLRIRLDQAEGILDGSVSVLQDTKDRCKTAFVTFEDVPILSDAPDTIVRLPFADKKDVAPPQRCHCDLGWCRVDTVGQQPNSKENYVSVTGFAPTNPSDAQQAYPVWALGKNGSQIFELNTDPSSLGFQPKDIVPNGVTLTDLAVGTEGRPGTPVQYLWAISKNQVYRKKTAETEAPLQDLSVLNGPLNSQGVSLFKLATRPDRGNDGNSKIYLAGSSHRKGAVLHFQDSNWDAALKSASQSDSYFGGLWLGDQNQRIVAVGSNRTAATYAAESPIRSYTVLDSKEPNLNLNLNTVTCVDAEDIDRATCWAAGQSGSVYLLKNQEWTRLPDSRVSKLANNRVDLNEVEFYASLTLTLTLTPTPTPTQPAEQATWLVGSHGTVLFINKSGALWLQIKDEEEDVSKVDYYDIWGTHENHVWIVGSGHRARVIDPTVPL